MIYSFCNYYFVISINVVQEKYLSYVLTYKHFHISYQIFKNQLIISSHEL